MKEITLPSGNLLMFEEISHTYRIGPDWHTGERVPGLHEVMEGVGICEPMNDAMRPWVERGQRVHSAVEQYLLGTFDWDCEWAKSPEVGYLQAYINRHDKFPGDFDNPLTVEELAGSEDAWIATIPDQTFEGCIVRQVKTGQPNPKVHAVQLALEGLLSFPSASEFSRYALYLAQDGSSKLMHYDDPESLDVAMKLMQSRRAVRRYMTTRRKPTKAIKAQV